MKLRVAFSVILLVVLTSACVSVPYESGQARIAAAPLPKRPAPDFNVDSPDLEGVEKLSDLRGQVVMVNFWASWCGYCRHEVPDLEKVYQDYKDQGFLILGVNVGEDWDTVEAFREEVPFSFPITLDPKGETFKSYWGRATPYSLIVDRSGIVTFIHLGEITEKEIVEVLKELGLKTP